jgi:hypothetical protein
MKEYGYKVCYREAGRIRYIRHFLTYTKEQAVKALSKYLLYPPTDRESEHKLIRPKWKIIPVRRREVRHGIWREVPF